MTPRTRQRVPGRILAWTALLVALAASVAANVAFAQPTTGPRLSAGTAPVLVVLAAGLLERVPLAGVVWWRRWLAYGGLGTVVAAAFVTSFEHQYALLIQYGNTALSATLLPVAVDGLIVLASVCLTVIADRARALAAQQAAAVPMQPVPVPQVDAAPVPAPADARTLSALIAAPVPTTPVRAAVMRPAWALRTAPARPVRLPRRQPRPAPVPTAADRPARSHPRTGTRTDDELLAELVGLRRDPDGTVPVRRAARALGTGPDRARRLLENAGLYRARVPSTMGG